MAIMDNYALWEQHDHEQNEWLEKRPKCICCGEHIQEDSAVQIQGDYYCDECLDGMRVCIDE